MRKKQDFYRDFGYISSLSWAFTALIVLLKFAFPEFRVESTMGMEIIVTLGVTTLIFGLIALVPAILRVQGILKEKMERRINESV